MLLDLEQDHFFQIEILNPLHAPVHMIDVKAAAPVIRLAHACAVSQIMAAAPALHSSNKYMMILPFPLPVALPTALQVILPAVLPEPLLYFIESFPVNYRLMMIPGDDPFLRIRYPLVIPDLPAFMGVPTFFGY